MKFIDYINDSAIQTMLVTPVAVVIAPSFFDFSFGVTGIIATFFIILCGYLASIPLFRLLPKSIYPNLIVMVLVGLCVATLFSVVFLSLNAVFNFNFPIRKALEYILLVALIASFMTWLTRHIT